ncbi:elongation factor P 5-aminopentanone reductase [Cohnella faecalis]|uniref:SDR family oxidoreductase n=1 Tax=Cohnella faecalis TaxID=2315694 RepID=A0A398CU13_9BACL|nr:3-oxoacyl-ACP reductase FabG [Cohnella faecalis]RIE03347.1 SDR family oxidoreductase [Cohnella faecalis]
MSRVALVTGASRGIGAAISIALAKDGADVVVQYRSSPEEAMRVAADIESLGRRSLAIYADLRSSSSTAALKSELDEAGWHPDIVVHCAGVAHYGLFEDTGEQEWDDLLSLHLKAAYRLAKLFAPEMAWRRWGRIIHLSSVWGSVGAAGEAAYSAAKGGLDAFTKSLAKELASSGVTVNAIAPGAVDTDMLASLSAEEKAELARDIPLGRLGRPDEIAELARFVASDSAAYITGQVIRVDGGWQL